MYWILEKKTPYKELGENYVDTRMYKKQIDYHAKKLKDLGINVDLIALIKQQSESSSAQMG